MSTGIKALKEKTKLSLDEMYDSQPVGKLDTQKEIMPEFQKTTQPAIQKENKSGTLLANNPTIQEISQPINLLAGHPPNQQSGNTAIHPEHEQDFQNQRQSAIFPKQQSPKIPTYKMTFNLTEDIYKVFNDLYAQRMLQGRKTEKSEMICEAILWLIQMEKTQAK